MFDRLKAGASRLFRPYEMQIAFLSLAVSWTVLCDPDVLILIDSRRQCDPVANKMTVQWAHASNHQSSLSRLREPCGNPEANVIGACYSARTIHVGNVANCRRFPCFTRPCI